MRAHSGAALAVLTSLCLLGSCVLPELKVDEFYGAGGSSGASGNGPLGGAPSSGGMNLGGSTQAGSSGTSAGGAAGNASGGNAGSGDPTGGMGGALAGMGGALAGMGGSSGNGGNGGSLSGNGGNAGSAGSPVTLQNLVGALDGRLIQRPCLDNPGTDDCSVDGYIVDGQKYPCQNAQSDMILDHPIGGTPGTVYQVTMHFYGIMTPKNYGDPAKRECERQNGGSSCPPVNSTNGGTNLFYIGDPGETYTASAYDTYEIRVFDQSNVEVGAYFVNSDYIEGHYTYVINYARTIPIVGGGKVRLRTYDSNCRIIKNCGATGGYPCAGKARTVNIDAAAPQPQMGPPPAGFTQPGLGETNDHAGLWWLIDVTGFTQSGGP